MAGTTRPVHLLLGAALCVCINALQTPHSMRRVLWAPQVTQDNMEPVLWADEKWVENQLKEREKQLTEALEAQKEREMNGAKEMIRLQLIAKEAERVAQLKKDADLQLDKLTTEVTKEKARTSEFETKVSELDSLAKELEGCLSAEKTRAEEAQAAQLVSTRLIKQLEERMMELLETAQQLEERVSYEANRAEEAVSSEQAAVTFAKELEEKIVLLEDKENKLAERLTQETQLLEESTAKEQAAMSFVKEVEERMSSQDAAVNELEERVTQERKRVEDAAADLVKQSLEHHTEVQRIRTEADSNAEKLREKAKAAESDAAKVKAMLSKAEGALQEAKGNLEQSVLQISDLTAAKETLHAELEQLRQQSAEKQLELDGLSAHNEKLLKTHSNVFSSLRVFMWVAWKGPILKVLRKAASVPFKVIFAPFKAFTWLQKLCRARRGVAIA